MTASHTTQRPKYGRIAKSENRRALKQGRCPKKEFFTENDPDYHCFGSEEEMCGGNQRMNVNLKLPTPDPEDLCNSNNQETTEERTSQDKLKKETRKSQSGGNGKKFNTDRKTRSKKGKENARKSDRDLKNDLNNVFNDGGYFPRLTKETWLDEDLEPFFEDVFHFEIGEFGGVAKNPTSIIVVNDEKSEEKGGENEKDTAISEKSVSFIEEKGWEIVDKQENMREAIAEFPLLMQQEYEKVKKENANCSMQ